MISIGQVGDVGNSGGSAIRYEAKDVNNDGHLDLLTLKVGPKGDKQTIGTSHGSSASPVTKNADGSFSQRVIISPRGEFENELPLIQQLDVKAFPDGRLEATLPKIDSHRATTSEIENSFKGMSEFTSEDLHLIVPLAKNSLSVKVQRPGDYGIPSAEVLECRNFSSALVGGVKLYFKIENSDSADAVNEATELLDTEACLNDLLSDELMRNDEVFFRTKEEELNFEIEKESGDTLEEILKKDETSPTHIHSPEKIEK